MNILVTGGAGFIGSHLVEKLLLSGHRVTVLDDLSSGKRENLPQKSQLSLIEAPIASCDAGDLPRGLDAVVHLAASPSVDFSWNHALAAHDNNLSATVRVIEWCRELRVRRLVAASSAAVYGNPSEIPIVEDHPAAPISPYGLQKLASEQYGRLYAVKAGFEFVALRLFNVYGPRQKPDSSYAGVLAKFVTAVRNDADLTINGDGTQTRDFIEVSDIARSFQTACEIQLERNILSCNVGTGRAVSLLDIVEELRHLFPNWKGRVHFAQSAPGDIKQSQADVQRLRRDLNITAVCTLREGLRHLADWQSSTHAVTASPQSDKYGAAAAWRSLGERKPLSL